MKLDEVMARAELLLAGHPRTIAARARRPEAVKARRDALAALEVLLSTNGACGSERRKLREAREALAEIARIHG